MSDGTSQVLRFTLVGLATTLVHFIVLSLFFRYLTYDIVQSTTIAFPVAVIFSYIMSHRYTFRSTQAHQHSAPKFALSVSIGFVWNVGLMYLLVDVLGIYYALAFLLTTSVVMINNYLLTKFWVFKA